MDSYDTGGKTVSGRQRMQLHRRAIRELPGGVPVNVFLYPLEGDYEAAFAYWVLSHDTGGSFISVSRDWP